MALLNPLSGSVITQRFGPSTMAIQPTMWHTGTEKAYWSPYPGGSYYLNVHAGTDFAGQPAGTVLVAAEAGVVTRADYDRYNGGGWVIEVEIKPGVRYSYNHCQYLLRWVGNRVRKGEAIARLGATGTIWDGSGFVRSTYGVHCHTVLTVAEKHSDGVSRTMLHDFADFMVGGSRAGSSLIMPPGTSNNYPIVRVRYPVNIRSSPDLDAGDANIIYVSREDGIYTRTGRLVGRAGTGFELRGTTTNDDGGWGKLWGFNRLNYVKQGLYY